MGKVSKNDVHYLAFEGGGGKGVVYLGVIQALEELEILSYKTVKIGNREVNLLDNSKIKGIAGTSIGSFTALLLSCGYNSSEIEEILKGDLGNKVFDTTKFGQIPTIYTKENPETVISDPNLTKEQLQLDKYIKTIADSDRRKFSDFKAIPIKAFSLISTNFFSLILKWFLHYEAKKVERKEPEESDFIPKFQNLVQIKTTKTAMEKILDLPLDSMNSMRYEFGAFLANSLREMVDELIEKKSGIKNCSFKQFEEFFQIDLVVTGFDITTKKTLYFRNNEQWQDLCVADAIRMSVSIPLVFKPVEIDIQKNAIYSCSKDKCYANSIVDGGLGNNFPIHVFDKDKSDKLNPNLVGFFLTYKKHLLEDKPSLVGYFEDIFLALLKQTTEHQIKNEEEKEQTIELDSSGINVLNFDYDQLPKEAVKKAKKKTLAYFT